MVLLHNKLFLLSVIQIDGELIQLSVGGYVLEQCLDFIHSGHCICCYET